MEEKEVKNEVPAPETAKGKEPEKQEKEKKELTPGQIQQRKKMLVYPLMGLVFLGSMYLIFAPSEKDEAKVESVGGFNADIPQPKGDGIISDKKTAYEQEQMENKQADKMRSLQDFAFSLGDENEKGEDLTLIDDAPAEKPKNAVIDFGAGAPNNSRSSIQSSTAAYRDMNRQLGSFYETPKEDKEKEVLKRQVEELTARLDAKENGAGSMDEQVALMEKSYELAAKYMNGQNGQSSQPKQIAQVAPSASVQGKGSATPVKSVSDRTVSGLQQPMSNTEFIAEYSKPRNYGFNTAVGSGYSMGKNTIRACVHNDQTLMDGQTVKLRLLEPLQAGNVIVPKNSLVSGSAKVQGERLDILVSSLEYAGNIIPVELAVYDSDGQKGLSVPSSLEQEAAKEAMANIGAGLGTSISFAQSAGQQVAMDITRGLMQGGSQYLAKKFRTVKVHLKANYQVMLYAKQQ
ncbi:conjugative transposon protein TraM [Bacteroides fragilis]